MSDDCQLHREGWSRKRSAGKAVQERAAVFMLYQGWSHVSGARGLSGLQLKTTHLSSVLWKHTVQVLHVHHLLSNQGINEKHFPVYNTLARAITGPEPLPICNEKGMSIDY